MAHLIPFGGHRPQVHESAFVAPNAVLIGHVRVEAGAGIWFGAVLRGDDPDHPIIIGRGSNIQDGAVVHVGHWGPTVVGPRVTVGHGAIFESCEIGEGSLIGMRAVLLQESVIGKECLVAAGAVVLERARIPDRTLVAGVPGRVVKSLEGSSAAWVAQSWEHYRKLAAQYRSEGIGAHPWG